MVVANQLQTRRHRVILVTPNSSQEILLSREEVHAGMYPHHLKGSYFEIKDRRFFICIYIAETYIVIINYRHRHRIPNRGRHSPASLRAHGASRSPPRAPRGGSTTVPWGAPLSVAWPSEAPRTKVVFDGGLGGQYRVCLV